MDPELDATPIHVVPRPTTALIGRILLATIFLLSGLSKVADPAAAVGYMRQAGIPSADVLVWVAAFAEILGGLAILTGFLTRIAAIGLVIFLVVTTLVFHRFWDLSGPDRVTQMVNFLKNLAILGGLSLLVAYGSGRYSLDYTMRKPMQP